MFEEEYIKTNTIDIVSALIDYILDIYKQKAYQILEYTENNLFLTTLMVINTEIEISNEYNDFEDKESEENNEEKEFNDNEINFISFIHYSNIFFHI